jgi:hypothetical protein
VRTSEPTGTVATADPANAIDLTGKYLSSDIRDAITADIAKVTGTGTQGRIAYWITP